ncbi:MAG: hypothetical protein LC772_01035, partial [Chloroflexi bacterium]|nr:hypothetical protein [Chloroflexota bacterium]
MNKPRWFSMLSGLAVTLLFAVSERWGIGAISASDWTIIAVLALFLIATEGLRGSGYLERVIRFAAEREIADGPLFAILTFCSAVLAATATNDVSLFVVVPITVGICRSRGIGAGAVVVLEAMSANVGSAVMPWGNPQNIFLFHHYSMAAAAFYRLMIPPGAAMLALLCFAAARCGSGRAPADRPQEPDAGAEDGGRADVSHVSGVVFS